MEYIKCEKLFRRSCTGVRTYWSLVCEALYRFGDMTKNEIIDKIGYCSSQSQVWSSLKHYGFVERIPGTWKLRLTAYGKRHFKNLAESENIDIEHKLEGDAWRKLCMNQMEIHEMKKDF